MNDCPCLNDVIGRARALDVPRGSDREKGKGKLLDRLPYIQTMLPGLDVQRSRDLRKLFGKSIILDLSDTADLGRPLLFSLLTMIRREVLRSGGDAGIRRMEVIEEAHELLGGQTDRRISDLKESTPSGVLRDLRKTETCGVVVTQLVPDLAPGVRGNLGSAFVLRQGHRQCVREGAAMVNLQPWREDEVAKLPNRHAIARLSRHGEPVYLKIRDAGALLGSGSPPPTRAEAAERSRPILEAMPYVKRGERPKAGADLVPGGAKGAGADAARAAVGNEQGGARPGVGGAVAAPGPGTGSGARPPEGGLPRNERRVFARIVARPWELTRDRMDSLGLDREGEGDARDKLGSRGLVGLAGKVGAKYKLYGPTVRGREVAEALGLTIGRTGKGGVAHAAIVEYTQRSLGRHSAAFRFQRAGVSPTTGGVQPDLLLLTPGGSRIPIQACYGNQPAYEADALLRLHGLALLGPGNADRVDFVIAVCTSKRHMQAVQRALEEKNEGRMPDRVLLLDFDSVVDPPFNWASVLEFPL